MIITTAKAMKEVLYVRRSNLMNFDGDRAEMRDNQRHITAEEFVALPLEYCYSDCVD